MSGQKGFTLAELLIALAILGVIATFTIPKVLTAQQGQKQTAMAKEAFAMISGAYQAYKLERGSVAATSIHPLDLTPYMNYVSMKTTGSIDSNEGADDYACTALEPCYLLHSGAVINAMENNFCDTSSTSYISFLFDPDGVYSNTNTGNSKSIRINLYYPGQIREASEQQVADNACDGVTPNGWGADGASTWFHW